MVYLLFLISGGAGPPGPPFRFLDISIAEPVSDKKMEGYLCRLTYTLVEKKAHNGYPAEARKAAALHRRQYSTLPLTLKKRLFKNEKQLTAIGICFIL
jgi:hypothetical protein